ncbi:MAG: hypothetical protein EOM20_05970 [Spartobacteria bacterium]|nr:hypothetical protein [Spartobacteria bacterium]
MKNLSLFFAITSAFIISGTVPARGYYVVDNKPYTNVVEGVTNVVVHDWNWARGEVEANGGGMISFDVDESPFYVSGGSFSEGVTIDGSNQGERVIFSGVLSLGADYSTVENCIFENGVVVNGKVGCRFENNTATMISSCGNDCTFYENQVHDISAGDLCFFSDNTLYGAVHVGSNCHFNANILSGGSIHADSQSTFRENQAVITANVSRIYMKDSNVYEDNADISLDIQGASNVVTDSSIRHGCNSRGNDNEFRNNGFMGGALSIYGDDTKVWYCHMSNSAYGLVVYGTNTDIYSCRAHQNAEAGMFIKGKQTRLVKSDISENGRGIIISGTMVAVGGDENTLRNTIHKNLGEGILIVDAESVRIEGNYIGALDKYGANTNGNLGHGILIMDSIDIRVGQSVAGAQNLIRGNGGHGISYQMDSGIDRQFRVLGNVINGNALAGVYINGGFNVRIEGNYLGTDESDQALAGNANGVLAENSPNLLIGGGIPGARNIISGNSGNGIHIRGTSHSTNAMAGARIMGNYIGTTRNGDAALPNTTGIRLSACHQVTVGGEEHGQANLISGNTGVGLLFDGGEDIDPPRYNLVTGNRIGAAANGATAVGNEVGIRLCGGDNVVGGPKPGMGNLISGNRLDGLQLNAIQPGGSVMSSNHVVQGNFIGTDVTGANALPNGRHGICIQDTISYNTREMRIGGTNGLDHREGNLISGNASNGIHFYSSASLNQIDGNIIGLNADASAPLGNGTCGICMGSTTMFARIYGNDLGAREGNVIAGNHSDGIRLGQGADRTAILNNRIGLNADNQLFPNQGHGIHLLENAGDSLIGINRTNGYNMICGNTGCGIYMDYNDYNARNMIFGNYIGALPGHFDDALRNLGPAAIYADGGCPQIGDRAGIGNVLNGPVGIHMRNTQSSEIMGNYIGFDPALSAVSAIMQYGILLEHARNDKIGDDLQEGPMPGNFIGATAQAGIKLLDGQYIRLRDNRIGCARNAAGYVTNYGAGIIVSTNCGDVRIGQSSMSTPTPFFGPNYIAGNTHGLIIEEATNQEVQLNYIGLTPEGTALGNRGDGVRIVNGYYNRVGDYFNADEPHTVIVGSEGAGLRLINTHAAEVFGNRIGLLPDSAAAAPNNQGGVVVEHSANGLIGHQGYPNVVGGNLAAGIQLVGEGSTNNRVIGNYIGLDTGDRQVTGNIGDGIAVLDAHDNEIEQNTMVGNTGNGIRISGDTAVHNKISMNSLYDNGRRGICLGACGAGNDPSDTDAGPNNGQNHPVITNAWRGTTHVYGYLESAPLSEYVLEFFASESLNPGGYAEGRVFLGADWVSTDEHGYAPIAFVSYIATAPVGWIITATARNDDNDTSEFSPYTPHCVVTQPPPDYDPGGRDPANWSGPNTDYDGDGKSDLCVYWPEQGRWYLQCSGGHELVSLQFGWADAIPVPADYDGDNRMDIAVFDPATGYWYIRESSTQQLREIQWGWAGSVPVPGDYDGDGLTDIAVYGSADGTWYVRLSAGGMFSMPWGGAGFDPVPGDYDGDDVSDFAAYERATGDWLILESFIGTRREINWGWAGAQPVPADYDGDSKTDIAVFDPATGNWYVRKSTTGQLDLVSWGLPGTLPVGGDYDGDKRADYTVYDPATGRWYILYSGGQGHTQVWGWQEALPTAAP